MIKYILKAIGLGLTIAVVFLIVFPSLQKGKSFFNWTHSSAPNIVSFASAARRAAPAVVNIYTRSFKNSHLENKSPTVTSASLGSGVIMNAQGYILTNLHVIANADQIIVALQDGRIFIAELVGSDIMTDLAVLKIDAKEPLPVIPQNSHLHTQVGDVVLAIGNPYNVGQTVTQGIISATGRNGMSASGRQDFIQTDAAINRGNSGGALVNTEGQLVGINTAAYHLNRNSDTYGISFAIPYHLAKRIMESLIRYGRVVRGYMGVDAKNITRGLAKVTHLHINHGLLVERVEPNGPAQQAGLRPGDIIIKMNQKEVFSAKTAMDLVAESKPGTLMILTIVRHEKQLQLKLHIGELKTPAIRHKSSQKQ